MRVGLDIDDTICQTRDIIIRFLCKHYKMDYRKSKKLDYEYFKENYDNYYNFVKEYYDELIHTVKLKPFTLRYLKKRGHDIIFLTSRYYKEFKYPYETTYKYLKEKKIPFDKLIICEDNKGKICSEEKIDIFFDDNIKNYNSVKNVGIEVYLMDDLPNKKIKDVNRIYSTRDIYLKVKRKEKQNERKNNF